jgi:hypothetical protein
MLVMHVFKHTVILTCSPFSLFFFAFGVQRGYVELLFSCSYLLKMDKKRGRYGVLK